MIKTINLDQDHC